MKLSEMTDIQKRIAFSQALGWDYAGVDGSDTPCGFKPGWIWPRPIPLIDDNSIREARETLTGGQRGEFTRIVFDMCGAEHKTPRIGIFCCINASIQIQADAFLLATGRAEL